MSTDTRKNAQPGKERKVKTRTSTSVADWSSVDPELIVRAIATVAVTGGALRFGYTRDGGAYALGVMGDGAPYTLFVGPNEEIAVTLQDVIDGFET